MTSLPETALAFARECMGWQDCKPSAMRRGTIMYRSNFSRVGPKEAFPYTDLSAVMDAAREWQQKNGLFMAMYFYPQTDAVMVSLFDDNVKGEAEEVDVCQALMAACLEVARKLKELAA